MKKNMSLAQIKNKVNLGRKLSEEHKRKIGLGNKDKIISKETREKLKLARLKRKERLGYINSPEAREKQRLAQLGNKNGLGYKHTKIARKNMSVVKKELWKNPEYRNKHLGKNHPFYNKHHSPETIIKLKLSHTGKHHSPEAKLKISIANKGKIVSKETREKMKRNHKRGEEHPLYKGDGVGRCAIHDWVKSRKPKPKLCEFCHKEKDHLGHTKLALANIKNHKYSRNPDDYKYGHYSCHRDYDFGNLK
jgi:hypothetical protein